MGFSPYIFMTNWLYNQAHTYINTSQFMKPFQIKRIYRFYSRLCRLFVWIRGTGLLRWFIEDSLRFRNAWAAKALCTSHYKVSFHASVTARIPMLERFPLHSPETWTDFLIYTCIKFNTNKNGWSFGQKKKMRDEGPIASIFFIALIAMKVNNFHLVPI